MDLLEDRSAVVTGGAQGLGRAIAERFVAEGARVVIADIDLDAATACAAELGDGRALAVRCDVTSEDGRRRPGAGRRRTSSTGST